MPLCSLGAPPPRAPPGPAVGFFDIVVVPLYHTFTRVFKTATPLLVGVQRNLQHWRDQQNLQQQQGHFQRAGSVAGTVNNV